MRSFIVLLMVACSSMSLALAESPNDIFEQRIMPIFRSPNPSSCVQCHLSTVDLKEYILPSASQTFASLRDQGLIDMDQPEKSKILTLIARGEEDLDASARMIHKKNRDAEWSAFSDWIAACSHDPKMRDLPVAELTAKPKASVEVIRHARGDRILDSFIRKVWSQRMRCFPCHTPDEIDPDNPKHEKPASRHADYVKQYGQKINLFKGSPLQSMNAMIASSRKRSKHALPLINLQEPTQSLLVLKPTAKLPAKGDDGELASASSVLPVSHLGGLKMHVNDQSYKSFVSWIDDYAKVSRGQYVDANDLPEDNWQPTQLVLRMKEVPERWPVGMVMQVFLHHQSENGGIGPAIAFVQGTVTPRRFVNGTATFLDTTVDQSTREEMFKDTAAAMVFRIYADSDQAIAKAPAALLAGQSRAEGEMRLTTRWEKGVKTAVVFSGKDVVWRDGQ